MSTMTLTDIAIILSGLAGIGALVLAFCNFYENKQNARKADIQARIEEVRFENRIRHRIKICNQGQAEARNVRFDLGSDNPWNLSDWIIEKFPTSLQPGQAIPSPKFDRPPNPLQAKATLLWEDDFCSNNKRTVDLILSRI